jgi:hypothetical protein
MATNVASPAVANPVGDLLAVPQASERSLNQPSDTGMRSHAQQALDASLTIGNGPDQYDQDGIFQF